MKLSEYLQTIIDLLDIYEIDLKDIYAIKNNWISPEALHEILYKRKKPSYINYSISQAKTDKEFLEIPDGHKNYDYIERDWFKTSNVFIAFKEGDKKAIELVSKWEKPYVNEKLYRKLPVEEKVKFLQKLTLEEAESLIL